LIKGNLLKNDKATDDPGNTDTIATNILIDMFLKKAMKSWSFKTNETAHSLIKTYLHTEYERHS